VAVYVDDLSLRADVPDGARVVRGRWSHLFADTEDELRAFGASIGLNQAWIQHPGRPQACFEVTAGIRQRALAAGARPVTWQQAGEFAAQRARQAPVPAGPGPRPGREPRVPAAGDPGGAGERGPARGRALRRAARLYLGRGLLPVPAWGATPAGECRCPRGAACPRPGKHPRSVVAGPGERDYSWKPLACHTPQEAEQRFADGGPYADGNLMLAIPAGMLVIDQDDDDSGRHAIAALAAQLGNLPPTLGHATPHGAHRIYRTPPGWTGRAWVGKDARNPLLPGIDLRVPGQILMAPPSQVPTGRGLATYGPTAAAPVADLPDAYLAAWTPPQPQARRPGQTIPVPPDRADTAASYVHAKISGILAELAAHEPGGRNTAVYTAALKLGSALGAARTTPGAGHAAAAWAGQAAEDALMEAAEANGYVAAHGAAAARSAIRSGLRNGLRDPRPLPDFTATSATQPGQLPTARTRRGQHGGARETGQAQAAPPGPAAAAGRGAGPRRPPAAQQHVTGDAASSAPEREAGTGQHRDRPARPADRDRATNRETGPPSPSRPARGAEPHIGGGQADAQPHKPGHGDTTAPAAPPGLAADAGRQAGRAVRAGDLGRADRLLTGARALDPERHELGDARDTQIRQVAVQQPGQVPRGSETAPCPHCGRPCLRPVGEAYPCLSCETRARLAAAGFTPGSPELQRIAAWNQAATHRGDRQQETPQPPPVPDTHGPAVPGAVDGPDREKEAGG
jgi:hypothetical protein